MTDASYLFSWYMAPSGFHVKMVPQFKFFARSAWSKNIGMEIAGRVPEKINTTVFS